METPMPSIVPPGISHPAMRSCMSSPEAMQPCQGRRSQIPSASLSHCALRSPVGRGQFDRTPARGGWQNLHNSRSGHSSGTHEQFHKNGGKGSESKQNGHYVLEEGDMKIQLSATTMAIIDKIGNIKHQWKRTKRGTRGGRNRRQEDKTGELPRLQGHGGSSGSAGQHGGESKSIIKSDSQSIAAHNKVRNVPHRPDSDCSSTCDYHVDVEQAFIRGRAESAHSPTKQLAPSASCTDIHMFDDIEDFGMVLPDLMNTSQQEMSELVNRLYGLVHVLQNDIEELRKTCAESQLDSQNNFAEVGQLKLKLQQVTSERDMLQQQVLFQH